MRYVYSAAALLTTLFVLNPPPALGQGGTSSFSVTNYQFVSQQRYDVTHWYVTYSADLVNSGPALPGVTATVTSAASSVQVVANQGTLHFAPVAANSQVHSSDSFTLLVDRSIAFDWSQVQWAFQAPVANAGPNQTIPLGSTVTLNGSGSTNASGIGGLTYSWSFVQRPTASTAVLLNPNSTIATFVADISGTYTIRLTVSTSTASDNATVMVSTSYAPPVANAGPNQTVSVGQTVHLDGTKSTDVNGMPLTYSWMFIGRPTNSFAALSNTQSPAPTFLVDLAGEYKVQLVVNDGQSSSQPAVVTITTGSTPPTAVANYAFSGVPQGAVPVGGLVQLDGSKSTDVNGNSLTYTWSLNVSGALGSKATLNNANIVNPTFTADVPGTYVAQLVVFDGKAQSQPATVAVATDDLMPPTANAGQAQTVHAGNVVQLNGSGTDPQSLPLTYSWSLTTRPPGSFATLSSTFIASPKFTADLPGTYVAQLIVNDGYLSSSPSTVTITTTDTPPVAVPLLVNQNGVYVGNTVYLDGSHSTDADNDPILGYAWSLSVPPGSHAGLFNKDGASPYFVVDVAGTYVAQLIVNDKFASSAPATLSITAGTQQVSLSIANNPTSTLWATTSGILTITLSPPAGSSPVTVSLNNSNENSVVSIPVSATIPANSSGVNVPIEALALTDRISATTTLTGSAPGYLSGSLVVTVNTPTVTVALNNGVTTVGLNQTVTGTITLSAPIGATVVFASVAQPDGAVSFGNNSITIPAGSTTGTFQVTGVTAGQTTILANVTGWQRGNLNVTVIPQSTITFPTQVPVGAGGVQSITLLLSAPAPTGGLSINLTSDNPAAATVPASISINAGATTGVVQITGVAPGTAHITATTTNQSFVASNSATVTVSSVVITTASLPSGVAGALYSSTTLSASGGTGSGYSWSVSNGQLPAGLSLSSAGVLSGTLSSSASDATFTVQVQDGSGSKATKQFTVTVSPQLSITTGSLPNGTAGSAYTSTTLAATGGTGQGYSWSVQAGQLPSGLTLSSAGVLSGTLASGATTSTFTVQVQDSGSNTATKQFTITLNSQLTITTASLPNGVQGSQYTSTTLTAAGGSGQGYSWSISAGQLPSGLTLSSAGVLSGTLAQSATTATFTVQVQDSASNKATQQFTITMNSPLAITTASLPNGAAGQAYPSTTLAASGGTGQGYSWSVTVGQLPSGLALSSAGILSGTLAASAGGATFTVQVQDSGGNTATRQFTISVPLTIITTSLPNGAPNSNYSASLAASGGSGQGYSWVLTSGRLPAALTLSSSGVLSGTLSAWTGTLSFSVQVQDSVGNTASASLSLTVTTDLSITTQSLPSGQAGTAYPTTTLTATGGTGQGYTWTLTLSGKLPDGLTLSAGGVISGTLSNSATTQSFSVMVQDNGGNRATQPFTITVAPSMSVTTTSLPSGTPGAGYSATLSASGGTGQGYSWSIIAGSLPANLNLISATGVITGTLSNSATSSTFTVQVQDSGGNKATKQLTISIAGPLTVTTTSPLAVGTPGAAYTTTLQASGGTQTGYTWSITTGQLPANLTLSSAGVISGTLASSVNTATFTVQVQDSSSSKATKQLTLPIQLTITTASLPNGTPGAPYQSTTLAATGGSGQGYVWSVVSGNLPTGLNLSPAGVLSGTVSLGANSSTFTVQVQDSASQTATRQFTIVLPLTVTTSALPIGAPNTPYSATLAASGGTGQGYTWSLSAGRLPSGLTLSSTGVISGTPTGASSSALGFTVQDSGSNTASVSLTLLITADLTITTVPLPGASAGAAYPSTTLTASGGTGQGYTWSITSGQLPAGLTLSSAGVISGTVSSSASAGTSSFTVQVQDSGNNKASAPFTITVVVPLTVTTSTLPVGTAGSTYASTTLAASGGTGQGYSWSVSAGQLPSGLTLNSAGLLSGTLSTSATTQTFTVQVQDSGANKATKQLTLTVNPQLTITTTSPLAAGTPGAAYPSTTLAASGGTGQGYAWSLVAGQGSLPAGLNLSGGGVISGTLSAAAINSTFTVQVQDNGGNTATQQFLIPVTLMITTASLPSGTAGSTYTSTTMAAAGGTGAGYTWSVTAGQLPSGLTLSTAGALSGTLASNATTQTFTVQVQDGGGNTNTKQFTITVNSQLTITTSSPLPNGTAGAAYPPTTLTANGGTGTGFSWSLVAGQGSLPAGLNLSSGGVVSGTLTSGATTQTFTVQVQDSGSNTATKQFTITVNPVLSITTSSPLPAGVAGAAYTSTTLAAAGGTGQGYSWSVTAGQLPAGLSLSPAGIISGTLSAAAVNSTFTVQVQDSGSNTATKQFTIPVTLTITTASLPSGTPGTAYTSTTLAATGGTGTGYSWSTTVGQLPAGLSLSAGGVISGTLTSGATTQTFTVQVQDSASNKATQQLTITVFTDVTITTPSPLPNGVAGTQYTSTTLLASGGTGTGYSWSVTSGQLPSGLTLSSAGVISGTLASGATTQTFTVQVQDSGANKGTKQFTINVYPPLTITTSSLPNGVAGSAYTATTLAASGGSGQGYGWSVTAGQLPSGLTLSTAGVLSGTLTSGATNQTFTVQVQDSVGFTATKQFTLVVTLTITTASLPAGVAGTQYTATTLAATGGAGPAYTWSITAGQLPAGLSLSTAGVISGTLTSGATNQTFTVQVQDSASNRVSQQFTITVTSPLTITTTSPLPGGTAGAAYSQTLAATGGTNQGYAWSITAGALPAGLALSSGGVISGTLSSNAITSTFTVQVQDSGSNTATKQFTIPVALTITTASPLSAATPGAAYSATLAATGGTGPTYTWSVTAGQLPTGLSLSSAGVISGTVSTTAVTSSFTVQVQDGGNNTVTQQFTIPVTLTIVTTSLPSGAAGTAYTSTTLQAAGGVGSPYTWSIRTGSLPTGLTLSSGGVISGTLSASATNSSFTVQAQDSSSNKATAALTITISIGITPASLPPGMAPYNYSPVTLTASGGSGTGYTWSVITGALPAGLSLSAGGVISGTLSGSATTQTFTVQVQDSAAGTGTRQYTLTVYPQLIITTSSPLPDGAINQQYTGATLAASGGTGAPYTWSIVIGALPSGLSLSSAGVISGTLSATATTQSFTVQVQDSGGNLADKAFTITINTVVPGTITMSSTSLPVGVGLQMPVTMTFNPVPTADTSLTLSSSSPTAVLVGNSGTAGRGSLTVIVPAGTSSVATYVQAIAASASAVNVVASASGYSSGTVSVTTTNSAFVLSSPNGIGADFSVSQGTTTPLSVYAARVDSSGVLQETQQVAGGLSFSISVGVAPSSLGSLSPTTVTFTGGSASAAVNFTASGANTGTASITLTQPSGFVNPVTGGTLNVTVTTIQMSACSGVTVGQNLQNTCRVTITGNASTAIPVTVTSSDASKLKFGAGVNCATSAGSTSITVTIPLNQSHTADFCVFGYASSGSVPYTVSASGIGTLNTAMPMGPSGVAVQTPAGLGNNFTALLGGGDATLSVSTVLLDGTGNVVAQQLPASDVTVSATVTSSNTATGTITVSPVTISASTYPGVTAFHPKAAGTSTINVSASGFASPAAVTATVSSSRLIMNNFITVGKNLAQQATVLLSPAPSAAVQLTVTTSSSILLSATGTDAGTTSITLTVPAGTGSATFWVYGEAASGTATFTASAPGYGSVSDSATLAPSGILLLCPGGVAGGCNISLAGGNVTLTVQTLLLNSDGSVLFVSGSPVYQPVAGGAALSVAIGNTNSAVGTVPTSVPIAAGSAIGSFTFHPVATGSTVVSMTEPSGYTTPTFGSYNLLQLQIGVQ